MPPKRHRHKLLFDEGLPLPKYFPQLNNRFDVKHIVEDFKQAGADDRRVYQLAVKEKRLIVTFNKKHFQQLAEKSKDTGVIAITHTLSPKQRDTKLTAFLRQKTPGDLFGKLHVITAEPIPH
jgi:hypothetical protein